MGNAELAGKFVFPVEARLLRPALVSRMRKEERTIVLSNISKAGTWLSFGLAFVGGYGDAASFVLAKTSTGHVTGNFGYAATCS